MKKEVIKPFDLEAYKNGAKVKTRNGREVRIICTDVKNPYYSIVALVKLDDGSEASRSYTSEGKFLPYKSGITNDDLVIVEEIEESVFWSEQKYKEALNKAKDMLSNKEVRREDMEYLFPELKESEDEDERIRNWLEEHIEAMPDNSIEFKDVKRIDVLHWLEKQKEFVSADFDDVWETADCDELIAPLEKYSKDAIKKMCHAWYDKGIELERRNWLEKQGAQPRYNIGDILCDLSCNEYDKNAQLKYEIIDIKNGMYICDNGSIPVSQQDEYKLVAKKAEQKPIKVNNDEDSVSNELREASFIFAATQMVHKASPEERKLELIYSFEEGAKWCAAQKPAWSEEDEGILDEIIDFLENGTVKLQYDLSLYASWLKSLKQRYTWKPSDEQIQAVRLARSFVTDDFGENPTLSDTLVELEEQLKKLK